MSKAVRVILALALALALSFTLVGCKEELPQDEVDRIIDNVTNAQFDSVSMDVDMSMDIDIVGGDEVGDMTMTGSGTGVIDMANQEMWMAMTMSIDIPELGEQVLDTEVYLVGEWMYTGVDMVDVGVQWFKMPATEDMWQQQSQVNQQIEFLESAVEVDYLGDQSVDGTVCYVFEVVPTMEMLSELLTQQTSGLGGMDFSQFDFGDWFREMSVKQWIAKDSYQVMKTAVRIVMEMGPEDFGVTDDEFEKMVMETDMEMLLYDYNQPVSIVLPQEALNAGELPQP